jgi:uncharacterized protein with von Willebrand factor type A (vWA) domain
MKKWPDKRVASLEGYNFTSIQDQNKFNNIKNYWGIKLLGYKTTEV